MRLPAIYGVLKRSLGELKNREAVLPRVARPLFAALACATLAACAAKSVASSGDAQPTPDAPLFPPRLLTDASLRLTMPGPRYPDPVSIDVQVHVDSLGVPDIASLRLAGTGARENTTAITRWIQQARFEPACQGGHPVSAIYRMTIPSTRPTTMTHDDSLARRRACST